MHKKGKSFYGKDITDVINQACIEFSASQEELDIEVLETGSAGIFGLCKKKAHIRVSRKAGLPEQKETPVEQPKKVAKNNRQRNKHEEERKSSSEKPADTEIAAKVAVEETVAQAEPDEVSIKEEKNSSESIAEVAELPTEEVLESIRQDLSQLLDLMGFPSDVSVKLEGTGVLCDITSEYEEDIVGSEGRTLDSLQYLLRKMMARRLPDRAMLTLNAGDFRQRRAEELKVRAVELAEMVKADGKTQAIPALNPSERRVVHMVLQEDKSVRSRSVGDGLFKKVLIYKPGSKGRKPSSRKRRGKQGGRSSSE